MLMKTPRSLVYLSADELGITEDQRDALLWVRNRLEAGTIHHVGARRLVIGERNFNMRVWRRDGLCGSVMCIGGWMETRGVFSKDDNRDCTYPDVLDPLFKPNMSEDLWSRLTTSQTVRAIDYWLRGYGESCWAKALLEDA